MFLLKIKFVLICFGKFVEKYKKSNFNNNIMNNSSSIYHNTALN